MCPIHSVQGSWGLAWDLRGEVPMSCQVLCRERSHWGPRCLQPQTARGGGVPASEIGAHIHLCAQQAVSGILGDGTCGLLLRAWVYTPQDSEAQVPRPFCSLKFAEFPESHSCPTISVICCCVANGSRTPAISLAHLLQVSNRNWAWLGSSCAGLTWVTRVVSWVLRQGTLASDGFTHSCGELDEHNSADLKELGLVSTTSYRTLQINMCNYHSVRKGAGQQAALFTQTEREMDTAAMEGQ
uniref:uncharacterized protein LOC118145041 n=1 Tax=Callithrix jacchus TaxID=9483 RepID=UPI00159D5D14|nr:uncharacterized protein LOC118145041 [Callithrix jacchus]